jgi:ABC-type multidrug transport system fused ATPase/permease subunit
MTEPEDLENQNVNKQLSLEDSSSWFSYLFFNYLNPIFTKGTDQTLEHIDLGPVSYQDSCERLYDRFVQYWKEENERNAGKKERRSLWRVLWRTSGYERLVIGIALYAVCQAFAFGPILILNHLVRYFEGVEHLSQGALAIMVSLMFFLPFAGSIFASHSNAIFAHIGLQMRNILITMIYRKSLKLSPAARQISSTGQIINMFSNDTAQLQR